MTIAEKNRNRKVLRNLIKITCESDGSIQNVHTPYELCEDMIIELVEHTDICSEKDILVMFNLEYIPILIEEAGVKAENIWFMSDSERRRKRAECYYNVNTIDFKICDLIQYKEGKNIMGKQFDVVIGNPPYHKKSNIKDKKTQAIWPGFVDMSFKICKENGHTSLIHPSGWRSDGMYKKTGNKIKSKQIRYVEIHDEKDGMKKFKAETRYDWYVIKNCSNIEDTYIKDQNKVVSKINVKDMKIIPNFMISDVQNLLAKKGEERVKIIADSLYHTQAGVKKGFMQEDMTEEFKYPCVYFVNSKGKLKLWYSNENKGHFGIPKLIFSNGRISSANYFIDKEGKYGLTQFSYGVLDNIENFDNIYKAMRTKEFKKIMEACSVGLLSINKDVLSLFKKDFWKEFI